MITVGFVLFGMFFQKFDEEIEEIGDQIFSGSVDVGQRWIYFFKLINI